MANPIPLNALDAVVLDTETTGLDPAHARIVEIGALRLSGGRPDPAAPFRRLVRPEIPVPPSASALHGLDDRALADAPAFADVVDDLLDYLGDMPIVGHSLGFDLAILARECRRVQREWPARRWLDTRLLAELAQPNLPDYSLEQLAAWLGIALQPRHSAVGDAATTAQIFIALLPKLRDRGIRTLAEAETACRGLTQALDNHYRAGWELPGAPQPAAEIARRAAPELFAYTHHVGPLMRLPVVERADLPLAAALRRMIDERISSVLVVADGREPPLPANTAILTERDGIRAIAAGGPAALETQIGALATRPLQCISADAFVHRAIARMTRLGLRHLGVTDDAGRVVGIVTARDLLRMRAGDAMLLGDAIEAAETAADLARAWSHLPDTVQGLRAEDISGAAVSALISDELCALTARAAFIVERRMLADGRGGPPCPFAVAVLGSGGRGESMLALDQDNALIYAGVPDAGQWFAAFGSGLADLLNEAGVPYCRGGVMTSNALWRGSLAAWRERVGAWIERSRPQDLLSVDIFFDLRGVYGDPVLAATLRRDAFDSAHLRPEFAKLLADAIPPAASAVGLFGRLVTDSGRIDLKKAALFPIVAAARVLAIRHHVLAPSTVGRLNELRARGIGGDRDLEAMRDAYVYLQGLVIDQQVEDIHAGIPPGNTVAVKRLSAGERDRLRSALKSVEHAEDTVRDLMFGTDARAGEPPP
jgi:DNA polymerase-3 subunit epsilon/CBS domain-containing protein